MTYSCNFMGGCSATEPGFCREAATKSLIHYVPFDPILATCKNALRSRLTYFTSHPGSLSCLCGSVSPPVVMFGLAPLSNQRPGHRESGGVNQIVALTFLTKYSSMF